MNDAPVTRRAVMLAAGDGGRLGHHTRALPKPLVRLNGRPLVDYTLDALVEAGVSELVVVTGYREKQIRAALQADAPQGLDIEFVSNPRFEAGASLSLRAAQDLVDGVPFLLLMSDHVVSADLLGRLLAAPGERRLFGGSFVAADRTRRDPAYEDEATRLAIDADGLVTQIGKHLPEWHALDAGAFLLAPSLWDAADAVAEDCELSTIFSELARRRCLAAADISGAFWYDVDTAEDLAAAAALMARPVPHVAAR